MARAHLHQISSRKEQRWQGQCILEDIASSIGDEDAKMTLQHLNFTASRPLPTVTVTSGACETIVCWRRRLVTSGSLPRGLAVMPLYKIPVCLTRAISTIQRRYKIE
ncbi:hypothetical protein ACHAWO_008400 [Cyclotella atomus]|uniref:Uncharacterized protein n=1 Tax=Cyclotella atomus TaxID=382360 RepID=A0ABD3PXW9_9STRA